MLLARCFFFVHEPHAWAFQDGGVAVSDPVEFVDNLLSSLLVKYAGKLEAPPYLQQGFVASVVSQSKQRLAEKISATLAAKKAAGACFFHASPPRGGMGLACSSPYLCLDGCLCERYTRHYDQGGHGFDAAGRRHRAGSDQGLRRIAAVVGQGSQGGLKIEPPQPGSECFAEPALCICESCG